MTALDALAAEARRNGWLIYNAVRKPPPLMVIETMMTGDAYFEAADSSWGTVRVRPDGEGWHIWRDGERRTWWERRRPVHARKATA